MEVSSAVSRDTEEPPPPKDLCNLGTKKKKKKKASPERFPSCFTVNSHPILVITSF